MNSETFLSILDYLSSKLKGTEFEGHVYAVGGSVRDYMMHNNIKDIDLVVDIPNGGINLANYLYTKGCLCYEPVIYPTYGTCMFRLVEFRDYELEAVHTRGEQYHDKNSRNPETYFGTLEDDCVRRDLTINALYYDIFTQKVIDPTGKGMRDIEEHVIRTSNTDPDIVFDDDPLRILRVIRFAARYDWMIDKSTRESMIKHTNRLSIISRERITEEFFKMLANENAGTAVRLLDNFKLFEVVSFTNCPYAELIKLVSRKKSGLAVALAVIYNDKTPEEVKSIFRKMKIDNDTMKRVAKLVLYKSSFEKDISEKHVREVQLKHTKEEFYELLDFIDVMEWELGSRNAGRVRKMTDDRICEMFDYKLPINGLDIMKLLNCDGGQFIGECLKDLYEYACEHPDATKKELIVSLVEKNLEND